MKLITASIVLGSALSLIACGPEGRDGDGDGGGDGDGDGSGSGSGSGTNTPRQCSKMDIMFVVDDSGSMAEEQGNLGQNFPMFADVLLNYVNPDGDHIDFRVAVTTTGKTVTTTINTNLGMGFPPQSQTLTETGDNGEFRKNCNVARNYLEPTDPNLGDTLGCRANVGTSGPGTEMPLIATKLALDERIMDGKNAGFIREDALLGVVMLTDEDDSSTLQDNITITIDLSNPGSTTTTTDFNPTELVQFLDTFKGQRSRWATGVIAGETACSSSFGDAAEATRLKEFVNLSGTQGVFSSICAGNLTTGLTQVIEKFQAACGGIIL